MAKRRVKIEADNTHDIGGRKRICPDCDEPEIMRDCDDGIKRCAACRARYNAVSRPIPNDPRMRDARELMANKNMKKTGKW